MSIEAMKMALEALERHKPKISEGSLPVLTHDAAITALRAAIEQSEKPVAWQGVHDYTDLYYRKPPQADVRPLYTAPRQEQYDQTSLELCETCGWKAMIPGEGCLTCARQKAKPVWIQRNHLEAAQREPSMCRVEPTKRLPDFVPLYAAPRQWVGLTDEEVDEFYWISALTVEAIEAKLKEKNT
jgi:hypothetical protein